MLNLRQLKRRPRYSRRAASPTIDRGVVFGLGIAVMFIIFGIALGGQWLNFLDVAGLMIVCGGTLGATLINFSGVDLSHAIMVLKDALGTSRHSPRQRIGLLVSLAQRVRQEGMLVLEPVANSAADRFLKRAIELAVDGQPPADVRRILEIEARTNAERQSRAVQVFEAMGNYAPAMGLIGTLIGLIQMLSTLDDPTKIGTAMAVALSTTLYGALLANIIFLPLAGKIRNRCEEELLVRNLTIEGIGSVIRQENPLVVEQRLESFMPQVVNL